MLGKSFRQFLKAPPDCAVHHGTWRVLPATFAKCNSTWTRFWRLGRSGVFKAFSDAPAGTGRTAHLGQMVDATVVRAHVSAAGAKAAD